MNVNPVKLAYRGVLIERPCVECDTVDIHFEGKCNSGPCQFMYPDRGACQFCSTAAVNVGAGLYQCPECNAVWAGNPRERKPAMCGRERFTTQPGHGTWGHEYMYGHEWVAPTYYPADIEFPWPGTPETAAASRAFHRILDKAREIGQPEHYTSDLFRDYQRITGQSRQFPTPVFRFVWALRSHGHGTDLFTPEVGINRYYDDNPHMAYFAYDGRTHGPLGDFVEVNLDTARTLLSIWRAADLACWQKG